MNIGEESEPVEVPVPVHPDEIPAAPPAEPVPAGPEPASPQPEPVPA